MLTAIANALDRFWNGPWIHRDVPPALDRDESQPEYDPARDPQLTQFLDEEAYWAREHDEEDERDDYP